MRNVLVVLALYSSIMDFKKKNGYDVKVLTLYFNSRMFTSNSVDVGIVAVVVYLCIRLLPEIVHNNCVEPKYFNK